MEDSEGEVSVANVRYVLLQYFVRGAIGGACKHLILGTLEAILVDINEKKTVRRKIEAW